MKDLFTYSALVALSVLLFVKGIVPGWNTVHSDFANYYVSAKLVADDVPLDHIYDNKWFQEKIEAASIHTHGKFSPFPPITAWLMLPLTPFEPLTAQRIFTLINLIFVGIGVFVLKKITAWPSLLCTLFILSCGLGLINNIAFGQIYFIMAIFILISFLLIKSEYFLFSGILLGIFTSLKYFPVVIIMGLLLNGLLEFYYSRKSFQSKAINADLKVALFSILTCIILLISQYSFFGQEIMREFFYSSFIPHLDGKLSSQDVYSFYYQSWNDLFMRLFVYHEQFNPNPMMDWPLAKTIMKTVVSLCVLIPLGIVYYKFWTAPVLIRRTVFISLMSLAMLVLLPVSATYHFALLIFPLALLLKDSFLPKKNKYIILIIYATIGLIPYSLIFKLSETFGLWLAYPRLWLISILFVVVVLGLIQSSQNLKTESNT